MNIYSKVFLALVVACFGISCASSGGGVNRAKAPESEILWLMTQGSEGIQFKLDENPSDHCRKEGGIWSGQMTLTGVDKDTLWFSDRPHRLSFHQTTLKFSHRFHRIFSAETGGAPNAVVSWKTKGEKSGSHFIVVELNRPRMRGNDLVYDVCGIPLDDPETLKPLPASEQYTPPANPSVEGNVVVLIDDGTTYNNHIAYNVHVEWDHQNNRANLINIAHRGGGWRAPESTMVAIHQAVLDGADVLELDFQMTSDGELVVMHDLTVDRTTEGHGAVKDKTLAQMKELDAGCMFGPTGMVPHDACVIDPIRPERSRHAHIEVPTLREVLEYVRDNDFPVALECKVKKDEDYETAVNKLFDMIDEMAIGHLVNIACLQQEVMNYIRILAHDIYLSGPREGQPRHVVTTMTERETIAFMLTPWWMLGVGGDYSGWTQDTRVGPAEIICLPTTEAYTHIWFEDGTAKRRGWSKEKLTNILNALTNPGGRRSKDKALSLIKKAHYWNIVPTCYTINDKPNLLYLWDEIKMHGIFTDRVDLFQEVLKPFRP